MPIKTGGGLETVSLLLSERQVARLREIVAERRTDANRVSLSDVAREVVEFGLASVPNTTADAGPAAEEPAA